MLASGTDKATTRISRTISPPRHEFGSLRTPLTPGERQAVDFFDTYLPREWEIYVQPHLNGLRPDIVLLHPRVGIAVFEIKDWRLDSSRYWSEEEGDVLFIYGRNGNRERFRVKDNPIEKIYRYKQAILELYCPRLGMLVGESAGVSAVVTAGVIMSAATTDAARDLLRPFRKRLHMLGQAEPYYPLVGGDALARGDLLAIFPEAGRGGSKFMTPDLAEDLRSWLVEPDHAATQRRNLPLSPRQLELVQTRTSSGYRRLKGPAGSGKSLVLAARAAQLSSEGREVLAVCYNKTLWHYLRDLAKRHRIPGDRIVSNITWCHFHEWCIRLCWEADLGAEYREMWRQYFSGAAPFDSLDMVLEARLPGLAAEALDKLGDDIPRYDAILVDEGQDFNLEWWNLLRRR